MPYLYSMVPAVEVEGHGVNAIAVIVGEGIVAVVASPTQEGTCHEHVSKLRCTVHAGTSVVEAVHVHVERGRVQHTDRCQRRCCSRRSCLQQDPHNPCRSFRHRCTTPRAVNGAHAVVHRRRKCRRHPRPRQSRRKLRIHQAARQEPSSDVASAS